MSTIDIIIDENTVKTLINNHITDIMGDLELGDNDINIEVKSKQNYRAEWETASLRAIVRKTI